MKKAHIKSRSLGKAWKIYKRKQYSQLIRYLEPQIFRYRENFDFYYLLGISCLYMGDYGGAFSYLKRCMSLKPRDINTHLALAVVYLKRRDTEEALRSWLTVLDEEETNKIAERGMRQIRNHGSMEEIDDLFETGKIRRFFPERPKNYSWLIPVSIAAVLLTAAALILPGQISAWIDRRDYQRVDDPGLAISETEDMTSLVGEFDLVLTEDQIRDTYERGLGYFNRFEDNLARREFNRLLIGNASAGIKAKAETLISHIQPPKFSTVKTRFTYSEVSSSPLLYNGTFVVWKGRVSDVSASDTLISFRLLVGYHEEKIIDGIVNAYLDFPAEIEAAYAYEFLAEVITVSDKEFQLKVYGVHRIQLDLSGDNQ